MKRPSIRSFRAPAGGLWLALAAALTLAACVAGGGTPGPAMPGTAVPDTGLPIIIRPTFAPATHVPIPTSSISTADLATLVQSSQPDYGQWKSSIQVLPLVLPAGQPGLWAAYPMQPAAWFGIILYDRNGGGWRELARRDFWSVRDAIPLRDPWLTQVEIEPDRIWLELSGPSGIRGGCFDLLSFDGSTLQVELSACNAAYDIGRISDVNGDGAPDVVIDASNYGIGCNACDVGKLHFRAYAWDEANQGLIEKPIRPLAPRLSGQTAWPLVNEAVKLSQVGLWKDAMAKISQARTAAAAASPPLTDPTLQWDYALIKVHVDAMRQAVMSQRRGGGSPLLSQVFYGDYAAAVDLLRPQGLNILLDVKALPDALVRVDGEAFPAIDESASAALTVRPDLAPAYFLRGWARYHYSRRGLAAAKEDMARAVLLAPDDEFFRQANAYLKTVPEMTATPSR